jgi:hypothetical protein
VQGVGCGAGGPFKGGKRRHDGTRSHDLRRMEPTQHIVQRHVLQTCGRWMKVFGTKKCHAIPFAFRQMPNQYQL